MRFLGFLVFLGGAAMALAFYNGDKLGLSQWEGMGENQLIAVYVGILVAAAGLMMLFSSRRKSPSSGFTPPQARRRPGRH